MKKSIFLPVVAMCVISMYSCEEVIPEQKPKSTVTVSVPYPDTTEYATITFSCQGFEMDQKAMTRGELSADGKTMTDVWVLDYMDGELVQQIHQTPTDADWGQPTMMLAYGSHHVYFIASRGATPVLDTDAHTITWGSVRDTFAKDYEVSVVNTSNGNRAVTMDRIVTKLKVTGVDEVPATCTSISVTPSQWFYGYDYVNDAPVASSNNTISVAVPSSYISTTGLLSLGVFSISGTDEWNTSVVVRTATNADVTIGQATITDAPFLRNRSTEYSGNLFSSGGSIAISMNEDWLSPHIGEW